MGSGSKDGLGKLACFSALVAASAALAGCGPSHGDDGVYGYSEKDARWYAGAEVASTSLGRPFKLGNCVAQAHRVSFTNGGPNSMTVVTADCPTSTAVSSQLQDGKSVVDEAVVEPKAKGMRP